MNNKKKLWYAFGPVLFAFLAAYMVLHFDWTSKFSNKTIYKAANSQAVTVFKGSALKKAAFKKNYIPIYGSSELSRIDALHPSVVAKKYNWKTKPFLLGSAGTQSLVNFMEMQGSASSLKNRKAVVIVSPQWFTKHGQRSDAFQTYYSPLQMTNFLLSANPKSEADKYAAARFASMPGPQGTILNGLNRIANGQNLTSWQKWQLSQQQSSLSNQDKFFSTFNLKSRNKLIKRGTKKLPAKYSISSLNQVANKLGASNTTNNNFGIRNKFFEKRLPPKVIKRLKGEQSKLDYIKSPEYSDFELLLNEFAKQNTDVLFVIPPVNGKWMKYTGLSQQMYDKTVTKIKTQLISQGFGHICDLSQKGNEKYYMEDTIHLGWKGWIDVDNALKEFLKTKSNTHYVINHYFYNQQWQQRSHFKTGKMIPNLKLR